MSRDLESQVAGVAALHDPVRRALYQLVVDSPEPVSREQAATAIDVQRSLAAFHLDRLADEGLLDVEFRRLTGRTGPGAGRPAKLYRRSARQIEVSLPPREYDLAGHLLAEAIAASERSGRPASHELRGSARELGASIGAAALERCGRRPSRARVRGALLEVLREHGFEPRVVGTDVVLANCPFHALAQRHTELVCGMNLHLVQGLRSVLDLGERTLVPRLDPDPGRCCVKLCAT